MNSSIKRSPQISSLSCLKEVKISDLMSHLKALQKQIKAKPFISPVFLIYRESGNLHSASFEEQDWTLTYGIHKDIRIGYHRKHGSKYLTYFEEYNISEIPYKIFVKPEQPLPLLKKR